MLTRRTMMQVAKLGEKPRAVEFTRDANALAVTLPGTKPSEFVAT